jgi:pyruvate/2-oxoglutarate/acetoin dehydrogenase E1 component
MKRYSILKIFVVEDAAVEVIVLVTVKAVDVEIIMKKRMSRTNRIGMIEDVVMGEATCQIIQMLSATTVAMLNREF